MRKLTLGISASVMSIVLLGVHCWSAGYRLNLSNSLPGLLYRILPTPLLNPYQRGQTVFICPPSDWPFTVARQHGYIPFGTTCPDWSAPLIKPVAAVEQDQVVMDAVGIRVNGQPLPNSARLITDRENRTIPALTLPAQQTIPTGRLFLLSTYNPYSWDSRYFGTLPSRQVIGLAQRIPLPWEADETLAATNHNDK